MASKMRFVLGVFAAVLATAGDLAAQSDGGSEWDPAMRSFGRPAEPPPAAGRGAPIEALNKILSATQLSPVDRSGYLSIRAFQLSRAGRAVDSQNDVAEMGRLLPNVWQVVLSSTQPELAGGGDRAAALRTLDYGLQRKPGDPWLIVAQAQVLMQLADFSHARELLDDAVAGATSGAERRAAFFYRGQADFNLGNFQQAVDDFDGAMASRTGARARLPTALWRYAAMVHTHVDARAILGRELGPELGGDSAGEWPVQIARFLLGRLTPGELELAAESNEQAKRANGRCPAAFFVGMEAVRRGDRRQAREQFQLAQARCPTVSEVNWAATSELKRL